MKFKKFIVPQSDIIKDVRKKVKKSKCEKAKVKKKIVKKKIVKKVGKKKKWIHL
jgi:hypothetical protein